MSSFAKPSTTDGQKLENYDGPAPTYYTAVLVTFDLLNKNWLTQVTPGLGTFTGHMDTWTDRHARDILARQLDKTKQPNVNILKTTG